ncbi:MAG: hypothetical protein ACRD6X_12220 [Pyrinomonadaceae bacterium]
METFLNEIEPKKVNYKAYAVGAVIGIILLAAIAFIASRRPSMEDQAAAILEGSYREGDPEFDAITKDIIISTSDKTVESPNAFGSISMFIVGKVKNKGSKMIDGLEVNVAVIDQFNRVVKEKLVLVVPTQQPQLGPGETIPITLSIDGFKKQDDRANIRWKVTAIRTPK